MSSKIYDIDFKRLVRWLTPKVLRKATVLSLLESFTTPVSYVYQSFLRYRKAKLYQLMITPQVCYLERLLNDRFDLSQRRIRIDDALWFQPWFLFQEEELKPEWLYAESENDPVYLYTEGESGEDRDDFVVQVPAAVSFDINEMSSLLDSYKLAGKKYKIEHK